MFEKIISRAYAFVLSHEIIFWFLMSIISSFGILLCFNFIIVRPLNTAINWYHKQTTTLEKELNEAYGKPIDNLQQQTLDLQTILNEKTNISNSYNLIMQNVFARMKQGNISIDQYTKGKVFDKKWYQKEQFTCNFHASDQGLKHYFITLMSLKHPLKIEQISYQRSNDAYHNVAIQASVLIKK